MTKGLTKRQGQVLDFISEFVDGHGYPPTVREVASRFGFRSPRAAHDHIRALLRKGYLKQNPGSPRALTLVKPHGGIPVLGRIAAGEPLLAVEEADEVLGLEPAFFGSGRFFALRVRGDSMIEEHIDDGDLVILRAQETAEPGQVSAVLLGDEVTLKYYRPNPEGVELRSANPRVPSIHVSKDSDSPRILGVMVGLVRKK